MQSGSLTVVGTGIRFTQMTMESQEAIKTAGKVLYLVADPLSAAWIRELNPTAESLHLFYEDGKDRGITYKQMVDRILDEVRKGQEVCAAFYGHPGIFVNPSHEAIKLAREEGFTANMLAAVSAEDCLFADLGIDPSVDGCQTFEATDFLVFKRQFDTTSSLIIWQIGCVGDLTFNPHPSDPSGINVLVDYLLEHYSPSHPAILYQSNVLPICKPIIRYLTLAEIREATINQITTLYIYPKARRPVDEKHLSKLGLVQKVFA
ncbi:MAG: hypothetical protein K2X77_10795 [Candidatus Obscuribacterales bacterium]|nr:hypothetical protein [Candidatus Obscuribacterales bacterium]